jgi:tellurite resistance protein TehA-like permease
MLNVRGFFVGTGAISIIFHAFPFGTGSQPLQILSLVFLLLNLVLFVIFLGMSVVRYLMFPDIWNIMLHHPVQSMYLGTFPMGGATLITVATTLVYTDFGIGGKPFLYFLWAMWWFDAIVSMFCCFGMLHVMYVRPCMACN